MSSGLKAYQGTKYGIINYMLRGDSAFTEKLLVDKKDNATIKYILQIDSKLKHNKFKETIFYRGIKGRLIQLLLKMEQMF